MDAPNGPVEKLQSSKYWFYITGSVLLLATHFTYEFYFILAIVWGFTRIQMDLRNKSFSSIFDHII